MRMPAKGRQTDWLNTATATEGNRRWVWQVCTYVEVIGRTVKIMKLFQFKKF